MIPNETRYKTHDAELLAIVEAFKTWRHYLESRKHEVLVLTDHNNLRRFMDTQSLSSRHVSLSGLSTSAKLLLLNRVFIYRTYVLPQLGQFWETFRTELADENPYKASISGMRLRVSELQKSDEQVRKFRAEAAGWIQRSRWSTAPPGVTVCTQNLSNRAY